MSRNNTPSVLSSLTAYDSSDAEEGEEEERIDVRLKGDEDEGKVTLLAPPPIAFSNSAPSSREPSPRPALSATATSNSNLVSSVVHNYADLEEDFDYQGPVEEEEEEEGGEVVEGEGEVIVVDDKENEDEEEGIADKRRKILLPDEPEGKCTPELQQKFCKMLELKNKGRNANSYIQAMKDFRNPSIYEKFIILCNIDENGTNFPDPPKFEVGSYYDELEKSQRTEMERRFRERERKAKEVKVDMMKGTLPPPQLQTVLKPPSTYIKAFGNLAFKN